MTSVSSFDGDAVGQAAHRHGAVDDAEDAARGHADRLAGRVQRDVHVDRLVELHLDEVDVLEVALDRVEREVADHREDLPSSISSSTTVFCPRSLFRIVDTSFGGTAMGVDGQALAVRDGGHEAVLADAARLGLAGDVAWLAFNTGICGAVMAFSYPPSSREMRASGVRWGALA